MSDMFKNTRLGRIHLAREYTTAEIKLTPRQLEKILQDYLQELLDESVLKHHDIVYFVENLCEASHVVERVKDLGNPNMHFVQWPNGPPLPITEEGHRREYMNPYPVANSTEVANCPPSCDPIARMSRST